MELVEAKVKEVESPNIDEQDLAVAYQIREDDNTSYLVIINADTETRTFELDMNLEGSEILVDGENAGTKNIIDPSGVIIEDNTVELSGLTPVVLKLK